MYFHFLPTAHCPLPTATADCLLQRPMIFLSPIWLVALLPWGIVSIWLMWGRRKKQLVPFLSLWQGPAARRRSRQSVRPPPVALAAMLLAMLLALLAAAAADAANERIADHYPP